MLDPSLEIYQFFEALQKISFQKVENKDTKFGGKMWFFFLVHFDFICQWEKKTWSTFKLDIVNYSKLMTSSRHFYNKKFKHSFESLNHQVDTFTKFEKTNLKIEQKCKDKVEGSALK